MRTSDERLLLVFCFFKQKTAYEMRISDWSSDVCSSDLGGDNGGAAQGHSGSPVLATPTMPASIRRAISPEDSERRVASTCSECWPFSGAGRGGWRSACGSVAKAPAAG